MQNMVDSTLNITDDANAHGGYMAIDTAGRADISFLTALASTGKFLRDDGTWAAISIISGGTPGHVAYTNSLNHLDDTPLIFDPGTQTFSLPIPINWNPSSNNVTALGSTTHDFIVGAGDDINLYGAATVTAYTKYGTSGIYVAQSVFSGTNVASFTMNSSNLTIYRSNANQKTSIQFTDTSVIAQFQDSQTTGYYTNSSIYLDRIEVKSINTAFYGVAYEATTAGYVTTNQTQYSLLHRDAGDARWLQLSGGTMTGNLNGVTPTELSYLSGTTSNIQNQLNNLSQGQSWKGAVRAATTANITLSGTQTIDGVVLIAGDRVLVKNQTTASDNGIYIVSSGSWSRSSDAADGTAGHTGVLGMVCQIEEGTLNSDTQWMCTTDAPITIGTTSLLFAKTSSTSYTASNGVTLSGNNFAIDYTWFSGDVTVNSSGVTAIGSGKVTNSMLAGSIADSKLASQYVYADGSRALTNDWAIGGFSITGIKSFAISGTAGNGYGEFIAQSSNSVAPSSTGFRWFANSAGSPAWVKKNGTDTYVRNFASTNTADHTYTWPDADITVAGKTGTIVANYLSYWNDANQLTGSANATLNSSGYASFGGGVFATTSPLMVTSGSNFRDGGFNGAIEIQATVSNALPAIYFGNQSGTARYGGLSWTRSTNGNTATSGQATIYVNEPTTNNAAMHFLVNQTVGTTSQTEVLLLSANTSTNKISGRGVALYINSITSATNKVGLQDNGSIVGYWGGTSSAPFFVYEGGSQANYRQLWLDTNGQLGLRQGADATPSANFHLYGAFIGRANWGVNGVQIRVDAQTTTDTGNAGTRASAVSNSFGRPTFGSDTTNLITITDAANVYISNGPAAGSNMTITNSWALWIGAGNVRLGGNLDFSKDDIGNIIAGTVTGIKIGTSTSQKIGFFNTTPIVQPTTGVATSTFVANTSGIVDDSATFGGYKISQIVKALQTLGLLA